MKFFNDDNPDFYRHIPFDYADIFISNNEYLEYLKINKTFNFRGFNE
ncbi:MAG: hypothetical protein K1X33_08595 [Methanobacteriaceae archaeon]|nr:hypothetical protein [Methanobacteriaceae archaeon]